MNQVNVANLPMPLVLHPIDLLKQIASSQASGYLDVLDDSVRYKIYFSYGRLIYATHSVDPLERLERQLRFLSHKVKTLTRQIRSEVSLEFEGKINLTEDIPADYLAIFWLVEHQHLQKEEAIRLITRLNLEVLESFLSLSDVRERIFVKHSQQLEKIGSFDTLQILEKCCHRLDAWKKISPRICSSYQRPYFFSNQFSKENLSQEKQEKLSHLLRGFNFRQLGALLNQDELKLAQRLSPLIAKGAILVREPQPPFDRLPKISDYAQSNVETEEITTELELNTTLERIDQASIIQTKQTIACIDDSPTVLKEINRFLGEERFKICTISDSIKALTLLIRLEPDLILMDVGMPKLDGYQLCGMLRKHSRFRSTPIIMVTGNKGLIDRVKARMAGATDYMTKPFTQAELLKMVFRYLS
jgi:chemotaxis family two-component system response regulator PixG